MLTDSLRSPSTRGRLPSAPRLLLFSRPGSPPGLLLRFECEGIVVNARSPFLQVFDLGNRSLSLWATRHCWRGHVTASPLRPSRRSWNFWSSWKSAPPGCSQLNTSAHCSGSGAQMAAVVDLHGVPFKHNIKFHYFSSVP